MMKKTFVFLCLVTVLLTVITACASKKDDEAETNHRETYEPVTVEPDVSGFDLDKISTSTYNNLYVQYGVKMTPKSDEDVEKLLNALIHESQYTFYDDSYEVDPELLFKITFKEGTKAEDLDLEYMNYSGDLYLFPSHEARYAYLTVKVENISTEALKRLSLDPGIVDIEIMIPYIASSTDA